jgi:hypothetical protein
MSKLFPRIPFITDETPLSWAARQAAFHTGGRLVPFLNDLKISAEDLARGRPETVLHLCKKAGQDPAPVFQNTIMTIGARRLKLRGQEFSGAFTTGAVTRICPYCLVEDQHGQQCTNATLRHRLFWRLAPVRTCSIHDVPLRDIRMGKWDDKLHELQGMRAVIEAELRLPSDIVPRGPSELQIYVERRLEGQAGPMWLDGQSLDQATRATEMLGGLIAFGPNQKVAEMTLSMWDEAGRVAWKLVAEGEQAISDFLCDTLNDYIRLGGQVHPKNAFGMLYSWLSASRLPNDPGPMRQLLRNVIWENMPLVAGQKLLGETVVQPRLSSIRSMAKSEFMHVNTLRNILQVAGLLDEHKAPRVAGEIVVEYSRVRELVSTAKHAVPVTQVPDLLTTSRTIVVILIELGILTRVQDHGALQSKIGKAIDGRSIQNVLALLRERFTEVRAVPEDYVHLAKASERSRGKLKVIFELLFGGHLKNVFRLAGYNGFDAIIVDLLEVKDALESLPPGLSDDAYFLLP